MGNLGFTEILMIAAVALIFLGPEKFPAQAKIFMRLLRDVRGYWDEAKRDLAEELKPVKKELKELEKYKPEDYLDSITSDDQDTSLDAQGYPKTGEETGAKKQEATSESSTQEAAPAGRSESTEWKREDETPAAEGGVAGTQPYEPEKPRDYVETPQQYPD